MPHRYEKCAIPKPTGFDRERKRRGAEKALEKEREGLGFLADVTPVRSVEERLDEYEADDVAWKSKFRNHVAQAWRRARAQLRALDPEERDRILKIWNLRFGPATAEYFADHVYQSVKHAKKVGQWRSGGH